jgi:YD repeat-containing protein
MDSPRGVVQVRYDPSSGRVAEARGPEGRVQISDLEGRRLAVSVTVTREGGELVRCSWNARTRVRQVRSATRTSVTRFDRARPLPVLFQQDDREVSFEWDAEGRLVELSEAGEKLRLERDAEGRAEELVVPDGSRAVIVQGDSGLLGWRDPEDRSTGVSLGPLGLPRSLRRPGGLSETLWWTKAGQLRSVKYSGGESLEFRRDNRGFLRTVESVESGSAGLKIDAGGRLVSYSAPSGLSADLTYRKEGGVESISDGYSELNLDYDSQGRLAGWSGPWSSVKLQRGAAGRVVGFLDDSGGGWTLRRDDAGRPMSFTEGGGRSLDFRWDEAGRTLGWERSDATAMVFERDAAGRVRAWDDGISGRVEIYRDRRGRIGELKRGLGLWQLERDRSGIVNRLVEPSGAATLIQPDGGGRASTLSAPSGLRWRLRHDALGRLAELRSGGEAWTLRRTRAGLPREFTAPGEASSSIRWDRAGRWTSLHLGAGRKDLTAGYGVLGPTSIGDHRRGYAVDGSLSSWGSIRSGSGWLLDRAPSGQVRGVRWRDPPGSGPRLRDPPSVSLQWNSRGQPVDLGPWALRWQGTALRSLELNRPGEEPLSWELDRDPQGRVAAIEDSAGHRASVRRDALGDAASFAVGGQSWQIERDSAGRVDGIQDGAGRSWTYERDAAGRIQRWLRSGDFSLEWFPTDESAASVTLTLAAGDRVEVTDAPPQGGKPSGGTLLRLRLADGSTALELEEVRRPGGTLDRVEGSWQPELLGATPFVRETAFATEPNQPPDAEQAPPSLVPLDLIGDAIASAQTERGIALPWGSSLVHPLAGDSFLPSALGRGVGLSSSGWQRLPGDDGGTVTWLDEGAVSNGMRLPTASGPWDIPEGWSGFPSPPATVDPPVFAPGGMASAPGSARGSALWWRGLGLRPARLARLPGGVAVGVGPGLDPRESLQASAALLPAEAAPTGSGVLLPALPGASRLLPGRPGRELLSLPELLVLSGDLAAGSLGHRSLLSAPPDAWTFEVPGADLLRALVSRRAQPTLPPGWTQGNIFGLAAGLDGLSSGLADVVRSWEPTPVSQGLPGGVRDVLPGECAALPGALGSLPSDGRCSALEDLSDDPLVPGAAVRRVAEDDSILLFLAAMEGDCSSELGGFLRADLGPERWSLVTPSGLVLEVEERGRLRSVALQSRQRRAWARSAASLVGRSLLHPDQRELPELGAVLAPEFLPSPSRLPESLWGLIPANPDFPISALGEPVLRSLRHLAPLSDAPLSPWTLPLGLRL